MMTTAAEAPTVEPADYERVESALHYLDAHRGRRVPLAEVSEAVGLSAFHFQRVFTRWTGLSPKQFSQYLTLDDARVLLRADASLLEAACELGLSGAGRLHDLFVTIEAVTPGEFKSGGAGLEIDVGRHGTPFGACLLGITSRGVCWLSFCDEQRPEAALGELRRAWPAARVVENRRSTGEAAARIFGRQRDRSPIRVLAGGTNFQLKVWEALIRIPAGALATYGDVAAAVGDARASRAVGTACGKNKVAYLIPCHRVIRSMGLVGNYGGGVMRKQAMIAWEAARFEAGADSR